MPATLDAIVSLQTTLTQLADARSRLESIPEWMQELHEQHTRSQTEIDEMAAAAEAADRQRREAEAEATDAGEKLKRYQQQISRVSTQREYGALLKEIDTAKEQINTAEQQALEALERHEKANQDLEKLRQSFSDLHQRHQAELEKWESEKPAIRQTARQLEERCEELRAEVPRPALTLFERIFERYDGRALAEVRKTELARGNTMWHCSACSFNVRPQTVVEIRTSNRLNLCDSCKRILHLGEGA